MVFETRGRNAARRARASDQASATSSMDCAALPVHAMRSSLRAVTYPDTLDLSGTSLVEFRMTADLMAYSPGFAAAVGLEALQYCKKAQKTGAELQRCVDERSNPKQFIIGPP